MILGLFSCTDSRNEPEAQNSRLTEKGLSANANQAVTYNLMTVEVGTPIELIKLSEKNLHGKFFHDLAEFYVVENPELYISNTRVKELTLYFIDGVLCKKKYELSGDISSELIKSYGGFKFKSLNHRTREITKTEKILFKTDTGTVLNKNLGRFQMKWNKEGVVIKYTLHKGTTNESMIFLEEELTAYRYLFANAENGII